MGINGKIPYTKGEARERLRPSQVSLKIEVRDWMSEVRIKYEVQEAFSCGSQQADVLLEIAVQNGYIEARLTERNMWEYRVCEVTEIEDVLRRAAECGSIRQARRTSVLPTTYDESAAYGEEVW